MNVYDDSVELHGLEVRHYSAWKKSQTLPVCARDTRREETKGTCGKHDCYNYGDYNDYSDVGSNEDPEYPPWGNTKTHEHKTTGGLVYTTNTDSKFAKLIFVLVFAKMFWTNQLPNSLLIP